jgi:hypothetical protein
VSSLSVLVEEGKRKKRKKERNFYFFFQEKWEGFFLSEVLSLLSQLLENVQFI